MTSKWNVMAQFKDGLPTQFVYHQKAWYGQSARDRVYQVGDKVLVLMPTSTHKLQTQWQGPYTISRRVGDLDYEPICGRWKRILHVNMLRKWHDRERSIYLAAQAGRITDLDDQTKSPPIHGESETWEDVTEHIRTIEVLFFNS